MIITKNISPCPVQSQQRNIKAIVFTPQKEKKVVVLFFVVVYLFLDAKNTIRIVNIFCKRNSPIFTTVPVTTTIIIFSPQKDICSVRTLIK